MPEFKHIGIPKCAVIRNNRRHDETLTVPIVGLPRGGTTMVAAVVDALGINLGPQEELKEYHFEDQTMNQPYLEQQCNYIQKRNQNHKVWGWKDPLGISAVKQVLFALRSARVLIVSRDIIASIQGEMRFDKQYEISPRRGYLELADRSLEWQRDNFEFIAITQLPIMIISYERVLSNPEMFIDELIPFLNVAPTKEQKQTALSRISKTGGYLQL